MNVLSLFDGISSAHVALDQLGITVDRYWASEVDKWAIKVTQSNYPETIQLGDVRDIDTSQFEGIDIDLMCFGSPCQSFSFAGKRAGMSTVDNVEITTLEQYLRLKAEGVEFKGQSYLFWEAVRILKDVKPKYFLMENVVMKKEWEQVITNALGVEPIKIDSALTSAAVRKRLYWTNIPNISEPLDRKINFGDIREHGVDSDSGMYYTERGLDWIRRHEIRTGKHLRIIGDNEKMQMLEASMHKKYSSQRFFGISDTHGIRYITPLECERCMGLPDGYTSMVSNTQRYKELGNGWCVSTIEHIFSQMEKR